MVALDLTLDESLLLLPTCLGSFRSGWKQVDKGNRREGRIDNTKEVTPSDRKGKAGNEDKKTKEVKTKTSDENITRNRLSSSSTYSRDSSSFEHYPKPLKKI